ncbi:hypothetical protein VNO77_04286 [Canavalia gladiata]|uniref:Uncharacterized protein n=1 Tax=Canavalia gladiata TaxID=3824 RepID=A0AAN9N1E2_CANGL
MSGGNTAFRRGPERKQNKIATGARRLNSRSEGVKWDASSARDVEYIAAPWTVRIKGVAFSNPQKNRGREWLPKLGRGHESLNRRVSSAEPLRLLEQSKCSAEHLVSYLGSVKVLAEEAVGERCIQYGSDEFAEGADVELGAGDSTL